MEADTNSITNESRKVKKIKTNKRPLPANPNNTNNTNSGNTTASTTAIKRTKVPKASRRTDAAQQAVNDQMRRALEEDQYSAHGSIVDYSDSDSEDDQFLYFGQAVRLDRAALQHAARKYLGQPKVLHENEDEEEEEGEEYDEEGKASKQDPDNTTEKPKKKLRAQTSTAASVASTNLAPSTKKSKKEQESNFEVTEDTDLTRDGGSIFGQTTGTSNATWVECDKCKKWRRLRGVVDEKKLPSKWYCSMNKNDPERARCSAPEEEYETPHTPESAAEARTRRHFRVWVRRLQTNEAYEARLPLATRQKKRTLSSKDAYEWIRCCNQKCGKWRALLKSMDAKQYEGEWFCVMNTWDEKMASCAAPQENLPALGCPPWVIQDKA